MGSIFSFSLYVGIITRRSDTTLLALYNIVEESSQKGSHGAKIAFHRPPKVVKVVKIIDLFAIMARPFFVFAWLHQGSSSQCLIIIVSIGHNMFLYYLVLVAI